MNTLIITKCLLVGWLLVVTAKAYSEVEPIWESASVFSAPESAVFDPLRNVVYVANYNDQGGFKRKDKGLSNEFISKVGLDGTVIALQWITSLENPTGMAIFNDKLFVVERNGVTKFNIEDQSIEQHIPIASAKFLNDIVVDSSGKIYVSDSGNSCIYRIQGKRTEVWFRHRLINSPNGLYLDNSHLLVGNQGEGNLLSIALNDKSVQIVGSGISAKIDGIKKYKEGYLVSWKSSLHYVSNGEKRLVYALKNQKDFLADFEYIPSQRLLVIPKLVSGKVIALKAEF